TLPAAAVRVLKISYRAHDGRLRRAYVILPAWYGPRRHPAIPLDLTARPRCRWANQRQALGKSPDDRTVRRDQSGRPGTEADPLLLGRSRRDSRPRADAADRGGRGALASHRPPAHLRVRRQHGRPGDDAAGGKVSAPPGR